jgi:L-cysteine S-thiosulfotransferase
VAERGRVSAGDPLRGYRLVPVTGMIHQHIVDQSRFKPETVMPGHYRPFGQLHRVASDFRGRTYLSVQEIEDVVACLSTLK